MASFKKQAIAHVEEPVTDNKKRTFYWLNGKREVIKGDSVADCMQNANYSAGALHALDFVANGDDDSYIWREGHWVKKAPDEIKTY